jgi:hypothetical protein
MTAHESIHWKLALAHPLIFSIPRPCLGCVNRRRRLTVSTVGLVLAPRPRAGTGARPFNGGMEVTARNAVLYHVINVNSVRSQPRLGG